MITSRLVFPSDFRDGSISLCYKDQDQPEPGSILLQSDGKGELNRDNNGNCVYTGEFFTVTRLRGGKQIQAPQVPPLELSPGDLLIIGDPNHQDFLYIVDDTTLPATGGAGAEAMLAALFAALQKLTSENLNCSNFDVVKIFTDQIQTALAADEYYVSYDNKVHSTVRNGRLHGLDPAENFATLAGCPVLLDATEDLQPLYYRDLDYQKLLAAPLYRGKDCVGLVLFSHTRHNHAFGVEALTLLTIALHFLESILRHKRILESVQTAGGIRGVAMPADAGQTPLPPGLGTFINERINPLRTEENVHILLLGESGSGKGYVARHLHSVWAQGKPRVDCNLAEIPAGLRMAELVGWKRGCFANAVNDRAGLFTVAKDGTLFLDEFGDLERNEQVALLSILGTKRYRVLGEKEDRTLKCKVVVATNQNLSSLVSAGSFRGDLLNRFIPLRLPALSERTQDIVHVIHQFCEEHNRRMSNDAIDFLSTQDFADANMWRLLQVLEYLRIYFRKAEWTHGDVSQVWKEITEVYDHAPSGANAFFTLDTVIAAKEVNEKYIKAACEKMAKDGVTTRTAWAERLGIDRNTLKSYLR